MHHAEVAIRVAELLDRAGYLLLGERRGSVNAQVRLVGKGSSLIRLAVGGEEFAIVVGSGRPRPCRIPPVILKFPTESEVLMARRRKTDPAAAPSEPRRRPRRPKADQPAPQAESLPVQEPAPESPATESPATESPVTALPPSEPPAQGPALAEAERELTAKYPHVQVIPGSLRPGVAEGWGSKRVLDLTCVDCGAGRTIATSDAFHSDGRCAACSKAARRAARKGRRSRSG